MATVESVSTSTFICKRCGTSYGRLKGYFPVCYAALYKGSGFMPYCKNCYEEMFTKYYEECGNEKDAIHQLCRKLDLYWNEKVFETAMKKSVVRTIPGSYLSKINATQYAGKCYDDTLREQRRMWEFGALPDQGPVKEQESAKELELPEPEEQPEQEWVDFWGSGYAVDVYRDLNKHYQEWCGDRTDLDVGERALYKQICLLEVTIARDTAAGIPVDKNQKLLSEYLGNVNAKPSQKKYDTNDAALDKTPLGVWAKILEEDEPIGEDKEDIDGIRRTVDVVMRGHLAKMLNKKNAFSSAYDKFIEEWRVERPEYVDLDDEEILEDLAFRDGDPQ